ncbi:glutamate-rich protein 3 [Neolamprologus brichardi]|uniref:glutamate-rich protein 3 n=1 Tax=Neolamprologus brichardi TaxID=32507 RepID=UPI001643AF3F|nr:glutamate-rich protein 3 [Neolamprologus brichardi]
MCCVILSPLVFNVLLLPRSVGPGGERRRSSTALPHEQNTEEDPPQEEQKEHSDSSESPSSSRPNTAPGKMQRPVRLKPIHSNSTTASVRHSSPYRLLQSSHDNHLPFNCTMEKEPRRRLTAVEASHGISPYCLPVINNFVTPVPPAMKRKERGLKGTASSTVRGRRLRPTTASSGADDAPLLRSSVHQSRVCVNMVYFGKTVRLSSDMTDTRDDVKVFQQHCGGENLCVYKGKLHEGETFQFISRRHRGFPFSLTFFLNGLQVERLSSCCEFKHRKGSRLGGKHGHFGFTGVEGASPCYKCIIAMGLDKKPTPPPKRIKEDTRREESVNSPKDEGEMETARTGEDAGSHLEGGTSEPQNMETPVKEGRALAEQKGRDDYEEDFEADDEGAAEEAKEEKCPTSETEVKERDASEPDDDDRDDMRSHSGSSSSGSEHEESDAEATRDINEDNEAKQQKEEETIAQPEEKDEPNPEEDVGTEAEFSAGKDSHMDSAGDSTEIEISDTSVPSGSETRQRDDKDAEKPVEESNQEDEQERAKSVQEKLSEAVLKESQCSSEPELSDTSTEEEDESTHKGPQQDNKDAAPVELVTPAEQQQTIAEEAECEESDAGDVVVAQTQEDSPETKEQSGDDEQEPQENRDSTEDDKAAEEEDKSEETGEALHPSKEENVTQDDKTTEPLEETPAETADAEAAEEGKEKSAEETDVQHDETGQGAKSSEEDESSEPDKKTDETAAPDNAEAARETIEIKAESSKEQEALSYEEAPVSDAEKEEQADSEDRAAGSETEVNAENSSSSPSGSGETTVEKTADTGEENAIEESKDDIKEEQILEDESDEQCELREERRTGASEETGEEEDKEETEEEEKQTHVTSDEGEDEKTEKRNDDENVKNDEEGNEESKEDEGTENTAESAENGFKTKEDEEEAVKLLSEEDKVADDEKVEEKTENDENKLEESEVGDKSDNESKPAVQENDDEAEKSENQNKAEKSEDKESKNDEEDDKDISEAPVEEGEEISETTEEAEKSANEAADGTKSADETPEAESVEQDAGKTSNTSEKEEINAENGEISTEPESNNHKDDGESQLKDKNDLKAEEEGDEESKADGPADDESADIKEVAVESEEGAKKHDADEVDQAAGADEVERDAEGEKNDESTPSNSQPETAGTEMKAEPKLGDRKDSEEAEDQNGNKSDCDNENKETDLVKKETSTEKNTDEVTAGSSGNQEQSPVAVDLDVMASKLDEESKDTKSDVCPQTDENAVGGDVSAADGENGRDAEDASKASEEGASVLLKPQNNEADCTEETVATGRESPEALATEDSTDLVSNWVNKHQSSKFFETFVEPLEDMREEISDTPVSSSNKEETKSTELPRSGSPLKMATVSEDEVKVEEKAEVKDLMLKPKPEQSEEESAAVQKMRSEEHKGSTGSLQECNGQESAEKGINEETEVESTSGSRHSASEKPASVSKSQPDEKTIENNFNVTEPQTEEANQSTSPLGTEDVNETRGKADEQSREVTETTDFTTSKSDDGSPEDSRDEEIEGKASDRSVSRGGKDLQLIEDIKHTLSKDRLSAFSVDDTLFAHSSYPLLTAASAESGH